VLTTRPFTRSCLNMPARPPQGSTPSMLVVSHLLDPEPTELHVFTSLTSRLPVGVVTPDRRLWTVNGTAMSNRPLPAQ
jgi:hypothetical protein